VDAGGGGVVTLRFRYALGNTARTGRFIANDVTNNITFSSTGVWTTYANKDVAATMNPGTANFVRFETTGQDLANIDEMTVLGTPVVPPPAQPFVDSGYVSGGQLEMSGFGGMPFDTYYLLMSSDASAPPQDWTPILTNQLNDNGVFTITNWIDPALPRMFFLLQLP
jgi:hypothetical protein